MTYSSNSKKCCPVSCMVKGGLAVIALTLISMASGFLLWGNLFLDVWQNAEMKPLFRDMSEQNPLLCVAVNGIFAIGFCMAFCKLGRNICSPCGTRFGKGAMFGMYIWFFSGFMGGLWNYVSYNVTVDYALLLAGNEFIVCVIGGGIVSLIASPKNCAKKCGSCGCPSGKCGCEGSCTKGECDKGQGACNKDETAN